MSGTRPTYDDRYAAPLEANRRGAHRARPNPLMGFLPIVAVMAIVGIVAGGAFALLGGGGLLPGGSSPTVVGITTLPSGSQGTAPPTTTAAPTQSPGGSTKSGTQAPTSAPVGGTVTKSIKLTVLNGTKPAVNGLAAKVKAKLQSAGWTVAKTGTQTTSSPPTTVYFATPDLQATAQALVKELGVGQTQLSPARAGIFGITIVVGNDYRTN